MRRQRRLTTGLAALAVVGLLAALRPPEPEVLRTTRLEIVDAEDQVVGGFGLGLGLSFPFLNSERPGWFLRGGDAQASMAAWVGEADQDGSEDKVPTAFLGFSAGNADLHVFAADFGARVDAYWNDQRAASLGAESDHSCIYLEGPPAREDEDDTVRVLQLEHTSGKPTIQGWDDKGLPTIDLR